MWSLCLLPFFSAVVSGWIFQGEAFPRDNLIRLMCGFVIHPDFLESWHQHFVRGNFYSFGSWHVFVRGNLLKSPVNWIEVLSNLLQTRRDLSKLVNFFWDVSTPRHVWKIVSCWWCDCLMTASAVGSHGWLNLNVSCWIYIRTCYYQRYNYWYDILLFFYSKIISVEFYHGYDIKGCIWLIIDSVGIVWDC